MTEVRYPPEVLDEDDDDGTMPNNVANLAEKVIGHRIVSSHVETNTRHHYGAGDALVLTLDDGSEVRLRDDYDCCAYTELKSFLLHPDKIDHVIVGVGTTDGYTKWHIYADAGDVLELSVEWSCGNPFYYGYGFAIEVTPVDAP